MNNNNIQPEEIQIKELIRPYMKRWKWFVLSGFFALVVSYFFLKTQNPVYETVSTVLIKDAKKIIWWSRLRNVKRFIRAR